MAQVGIYLLGSVDDDPLLTVCKLCDKYAAAGRRIYGFAPDGVVAADLDQKLWTFREGSFIPHERYAGGDVEMPIPAVLIGGVEGPASHREVLVNLDQGVPAWYSGFERIVEVVPKGTEIRAACRVRFKQYKAEGHEVKTFEQDPAGRWAQRA